MPAPAPLAQGIEQLPSKQWVRGSNPRRGTFDRHDRRERQDHRGRRQPLLLLLERFAHFYFIAAAVIPIAAPLTIAITPDNAWKSIYDTFSALHGITALLLLPLVLQFALALIGFQHSDLAPIAGLHGLNALLLVGLALRLTWQHWAFWRGVTVEA
jgi:hypothetical protein